MTVAGEVRSEAAIGYPDFTILLIRIPNKIFLRHLVLYDLAISE